jgi:cytochrome c biogenesis protein CcmG/thiol:disulfide interchange protein DsbE
MSTTRTDLPTRSRLAGLLAAAALVVAVCNGGGGHDDATSGAAVAALPDVPLIPFDGGPVVTLNDFVGDKPIVVNFWAEWCPSCVAEMSAAFKPVQERLGDRVTFLGINMQDVRERAIDLLDETGVQWISLENEDGSLHTELGGLAMPFTVFITPEGEIVERHNGPLNESALLDRIQEKLLR